jgi:hypothetical protein
MRRNPIPLADVQPDDLLDWALGSGQLEIPGFPIPKEVKDAASLRRYVKSGKDDDFMMELVLEYAHTYAPVLRQLYRDGEIELYRSLTLWGDDELQTDGVGVSWSYDEDCAFAHHGAYTEDAREIILGAVAPAASVDLERSILRFLAFGDSECEVALLKGALVWLVSIDGEPLPARIEATV